MKTFYKTSSPVKLLAAVAGILVLNACGSSKQVSYEDNDGIYSNTASNEETVEDRNYYKQFFNAKAKQYESINESESTIFTDVESYTSTNGTVTEDGYIYEEYGGWGDNQTEITVNVYPSYGYGYYWHRPHWWYYGGWGIGYWGYYGPSWYWYWPWYYPSYYGGYYHHHHYYYPHYYGGYDNYVVYNRGRRNTDFIYRGSGSRGFETSGRNSYSSREGVRRSGVSNDSRNSSAIRNSNSSRNSGSSVLRNSTNTKRNSGINRNTNRNVNRNSTINRNSNSNRSSIFNRPSSSNRSGSYNSGSGRSSGNSSGTRGSSGKRSGGRG